ncbi:hypothetical protein FXV83_07190 [Bradyrhizobium hipponense]|uniref:Uncharacterized protein n=1 Tax=Bradyrhizobium hipponense TaxID=2605638 RepID=A0A5S4YVJ2_9BRAD|nr:hypothetical protein [Bradyrhizobium hipponense]TYO67375.1 hypothetical protein FXV83_07190 [Bradyrhizobium hipponense]
MTAEVCIMNRLAAVLAADSAATVSQWTGEKVESRYFKGSNKIFQLSDHHPVGLMIFDSAGRADDEVALDLLTEKSGDVRPAELAGQVLST